MDAREFVRSRLSSRKADFAWPPAEGTNLIEWENRLRQRVRSHLGALDEPFPEPNVTALHEDRIGGGTRIAIKFATREGIEAFGYLLIPGAPRGPGVLCLHGHGVGIDPNVGIGDEDYQHRFALTSMSEGYITLALEQISFGRRRSAPVPAAPDAWTCDRDAAAALMLGESMVGWRVRDAMAAIDVLLSTPGVDPSRIATIGISGGGTTSFFTGIADNRVSACVVSGYYCSFLDSILSIDHCCDNYIPGIGLVGDMPDLVAAIAPRKLFVESGTDDPIFPAHSFLKTCDVARSIYAAFGVPENFGSELFEGDHHFHGAGAFAKLREWFVEPPKRDPSSKV